MEEDDYSGESLVDIVRGLKEIGVDPNGTPTYEETQDGENIRLSDGDMDAPEQW